MEKGKTNPPRKVRVRIVKDEDDQVIVSLYEDVINESISASSTKEDSTDLNTESSNTNDNSSTKDIDKESNTKLKQRILNKIFFISFYCYYIKYDYLIIFASISGKYDISFILQFISGSKSNILSFEIILFNQIINEKIKLFVLVTKCILEKLLLFSSVIIFTSVSELSVIFSIVFIILSILSIFSLAG